MQAISVYPKLRPVIMRNSCQWVARPKLNAALLGERIAALRDARGHFANAVSRTSSASAQQNRRLLGTARPSRSSPRRSKSIAVALGCTPRRFSASPCRRHAAPARPAKRGKFSSGVSQLPRANAAAHSRQRRGRAYATSRRRPAETGSRCKAGTADAGFRRTVPFKADWD